jgi:DNA-binding NarL/FixJ family response regulator
MTQLLLVDDHPMCADALERALKPLRPQAICHRALTLKAALLLLAQSTLYEVIFLDLKLPDSHGIDAIGRC